MKKTIAKMMAGLMLLSVLPAVSLPTLTAEAASPTEVYVYSVTDSTVYSLTGVAGSDNKVEVKKHIETNADGTYAYTYWDNEFSVDEGSPAEAFSSFIVNGDAKDFIDSVEVIREPEDNDFGYLRFTLKGSASSLAKLVKEGKNTFSVQGVVASGITAYDDDESGNVLSSPVNLGTYRLGGKSTYADGKTEVAVADWSTGDDEMDSYLKSNGKAYIKVILTSSGEITIQKSADLNFKDNDSLRSKTLTLNKIKVDGFPYPVTKFGAQALKEAHMKKLVAENVKSVGKGALRKCKQVKKVDLDDGQKVRKIHEKAFYNDKNLNTINLDGRKLNTVGSNAFFGVKKNCNIKIKAKKSKFESDKKMILKNGGNKNLKFTRVAP